MEVAAVIRGRHCQTAFSFNTLVNSALGRSRIDEPLESAGICLTAHWIDHSDQFAPTSQKSAKSGAHRGAHREPAGSLSWSSQPRR